MADTQIVEHVREAVSIQRAERRVGDRINELVYVQNREIVALGAAAVEAGEFTSENAIEKTKATVVRHLELMHLAGILTVDTPKEMSLSHGRFNVGTDPIPFVPGMATSLRQVSYDRFSADGFWTRRQAIGLEAALDDFASPSTTAIAMHDLRHKERQTAVLPLISRNFYDPDPEFAKEWRRDFLLLRKELDAPIQATPTIDQDVLPLTEKMVIVLAGRNIRFNGLLDIINDRIASA